MKHTIKLLLSFFVAQTIIFSCTSNKKEIKTTSNDIALQSEQLEEKAVGAVYVASNKASQNTIVGFKQLADGKLEKIGEFNSGGKGTGNIEIFDWGFDETHPLKDGIDPLISAYGIFKTSDNKNVLVVNSGDATLSSFAIQNDYSLKLTSTVKTKEKHPLSIAAHNNLIYVASSGSVAQPPFSGNISGFILENGTLEPIENSTRNLNARPSCIAFTPDGKFIIVNELVTGLVKVFKVLNNGQLSDEPISSISCPHDAENGRWLPIPVGFDIVQREDHYVVLVSEARFLNNKGMLREEKDKVPQSPLYSWQTGSTSSFVVNTLGEISLASGDVLTGKNIEGGQIANCWVEASADGTTLWAANALSSSISSYKIMPNGEIELKEEMAFKEPSETLFFSDIYLSVDGKYLYQLIGNKGEILVFKIQSDSKLNLINRYKGLPKIGAYGVITVN